MTDANRTPQASPDSNVIVANLSGGLNVTSGSLQIPSGDSPLLKNVLVNEAGNWRTREGTQHLAEVTSSSTVGFCGLSYKTKAGYDLAIIKDKTDLAIYELKSTQQSVVDSFNLLMTKSNVWPDIAANIRFDHVVTNETNSRVVFTTGISTPVQLQFFETSKTLSSGSSIANFTVDSTSLEFASIANVVVWVNGVTTDLSTVSYSAGTLTVTFDTALAAGTYFVDFAFITWQWWAEAALYEGRYFYQPQTRFSADINDLSITIPTDLLRTFDTLGKGAFNLIPYQGSDHDDYYTFAANYTPDLVSEFSFSQGVTYDPADSKAIVPGISHITFGVLPSAAEEVHFIKAEPLLFNGGTGIAGDNLIVLVDEVAASQNTNGATSSGTWGDTFYLRNKPGTISNFYGQTSVETTSNTKAEFITFDATSTIGLPFSALVKLINKNDNGFAGTAATTNYDGDNTFRDGGLYPAYGLYEWADYSAGSFPRTVELYQGRLVFGGFPNKPLQVVFSNTFDSSVPGVFFNNFSVATENLQSIDAVSVFLSSVQNDAAITAIVSFGNSLFAFTRNKTIRLYGGDAGITPSSITSSVVASVGALNFASVVLIDSSVIFLSSSGLYQLAPSIQVGDFTVRPASAKVTSLLKNLNNVNVAWIAHNRRENELIVAVTDDDTALVANRIYHLSLFREAWAEFTMFYGKFNTSYGFTVNANQTFVLMSTTRETGTVGADFDLITYPYFYPTDVTKESTAELSSVSFDLVFSSESTYNNNVPVKPLSFNPAPIQIFKDVEVKVGSETLVFNSDYYKRDDNDVSAFLNIDKLLNVGDTVLAYPIDESGKYPVAFFKDNVQQSDYTVAVTNSAVTATINFDNPSGTVKRYGYTYPAIASSPLLVRQTISRPKNLKHLYVLLYNKQFLDTYLDSDVNTSANQGYDELVNNWKREIGLNVAIRLDKGSVKSSSNQINTDLHYDVGRYDVDAPALQSSEHAKVVFALRGIANHVRILFYSFSPRVWEITGYELVARFAQRTSKNSWD